MTDGVGITMSPGGLCVTRDTREFNEMEIEDANNETVGHVIYM